MKKRKPSERDAEYKKNYYFLYYNPTYSRFIYENSLHIIGLKTFYEKVNENLGGTIYGVTLR